MWSKIHREYLKPNLNADLKGLREKQPTIIRAKYVEILLFYDPVKEMGPLGGIKELALKNVSDFIELDHKPKDMNVAMIKALYNIKQNSKG